MNSVGSNKFEIWQMYSVSLSDCQDIGIRKFEFVAITWFLFGIFLTIKILKMEKQANQPISLWYRAGGPAGKNVSGIRLFI